MAKLAVRRGGSGRSVRKDVLVRIQFLQGNDPWIRNSHFN